MKSEGLSPLYCHPPLVSVFEIQPVHSGLSMNKTIILDRVITSYSSVASLKDSGYSNFFIPHMGAAGSIMQKDGIVEIPKAFMYLCSFSCSLLRVTA